MISVIAIDPGKDTGWAFFRRGVLTASGLIVEKDFSTYYDELEALCRTHWDVDMVGVVEKPRIYDRRRWKGDPNDLIDVAVKAGASAHALSYSSAVELVTPQEWKGQQPKNVNHAQTLVRLISEELEVLNKAKEKISLKKIHNVLDAVGIGLWRLGRR